MSLDAALIRMGALTEGFANHLTLWGDAVKADKRRPKLDSMGQAELAFLPAALEISETPASPLARATAITIAAFFTVTIAWACIGDLDIVATASGKLIPSERVKQIQPLETSIVRSVHVTEGQAVKAGQILVELEVTGGVTDVNKLLTELDSTRADIARLEAVLAPDPLTAFNPPHEVPGRIVAVQRALLVSQINEHKAKVAALEAELAKRQAEIATTGSEIARLASTAVMVLDEAGRRQELATKGFGSQIDRLRAEKELAENSGQQQVHKARLVETRAAIQALKAQISQAREEFRRDASIKLAEANGRAAAAEQDLAKAADRQRVQKLTAPVDGIVQQIEIHTIGGVVTPAQKLMVVVPKDSVLEVEAKLANKDMGFVEAGQKAEVKIDAFPFTRYGTIAAKVENVSLDAVKDEESPTKDYMFPVRLSLAEAVITLENGKTVALTPGMTVTAEVKTGTRKPIEYVLAPLKKYGMESGRER